MKKNNELVIYENILHREIVKLHILEVLGFKEIGKRVKKAPRSFMHLIHSIGIHVLNPGLLFGRVKEHFNGNYNIEIPDYLNDIITGSLLGDVQIRLQSKTKHHLNQPPLQEYLHILEELQKVQNKLKKNISLTYGDIKYWNYASDRFAKLNTATFRIHKSIFELEWVKLLFSEFEKNYSTTGFIKPIKKGVKADRLKWSCGFDTGSSYQLFRIWLEWYTKNDKKVTKRLPDSFNTLTPNILLHWYIGDGSISKKALELYTFGFSLDDQKKLKYAFDRIGISVEIRFKDDLPFLRISSKQENKLNFFYYLSQAKYYNEAVKLLPHKFSSKLTRDEVKDKLRDKYPEYFDPDADLSWYNLE